jgi:hypothetical protein
MKDCGEELQDVIWPFQLRHLFSNARGRQISSDQEDAEQIGRTYD